MTAPKFVFVGHVCIDHNITEHASYTSWGSAVLYMANYIYTETGARSNVVASYGPDIVEHLPSVVMLPDTPDQPQTLVYENNTRVTPRIWKAHHTQFATAPAITPQITAAIHQADILVLGTLLPNYSPSYVRELLGHASTRCLKVLCPQGYLRHIADDGLVVPRDFVEAPELVSLFDLTVLSEEDHPHALQMATGWAASVGAKSIVTQGAQGASVVAGRHVQQIPTTPLAEDEIVDSVGCGDVFAVAVAEKLYASHDLERAVRHGHAAARKKLLSAAGRTSTTIAV